MTFRPAFRSARSAAALAAALTLTAAPVPASQKPCRDAQGKIIKCPKPPRAASPRCKDANGRFVKCPDKGATKG